MQYMQIGFCRYWVCFNVLVNAVLAILTSVGSDKYISTLQFAANKYVMDNPVTELIIEYL